MNREIKFRENWRWVAGFEGLYKISSKGRVKSVKRKGVTVDRILKHNLDSSGYPQVKMYKNRKGLTINIHRLMAYTYLKHTKDSNLIIDHKDNNPENNSIGNLQLVTLRKNLTKDKKNKTSKYPGVHWSMEREKWIASITLNKKHMYLGGFDVEEEAYLTYHKAIKFCYLFKDNVKLFRLELKDIKLNETPELLNA